MAGVLRLELRPVVLETIMLTIDTIPLCLILDILYSFYFYFASNFLKKIFGQWGRFFLTQL